LQEAFSKILKWVNFIVCLSVKHTIRTCSHGLVEMLCGPFWWWVVCSNRRISCVCRTSHRSSKSLDDELFPQPTTQILRLWRLNMAFLTTTIQNTSFTVW